jgi:hypothetical protein
VENPARRSAFPWRFFHRSTQATVFERLFRNIHNIVHPASTSTVDKHMIWPGPALQDLSAGLTKTSPRHTSYCYKRNIRGYPQDPPAATHIACGKPCTLLLCAGETFTCQHKALLQ